MEKILMEAIVRIFINTFPVILLPLLIHVASGIMTRSSCKLLGVKGYFLVFGWLGTAVHELSHAAVALVFGHRIERIRLFSFPSGPGEKRLGSVSHRYDPSSLYQRAGNLFIAAAPIFLGALLVRLLATLLGQDSLFPPWDASFYSRPDQAVLNFIKNISAVLEQGAPGQWMFWLFLYLAFSLGSAMRLSKADLKSAGTGGVLFLLLLFIAQIMQDTTSWVPCFTCLFYRAFFSIIPVLFFVLLIHAAFALIFSLLAKLL